MITILGLFLIKINSGSYSINSETPKRKKQYDFKITGDHKTGLNVLLDKDSNRTIIMNFCFGDIYKIKFNKDIIYKNPNLKFNQTNFSLNNLLTISSSIILNTNEIKITSNSKNYFLYIHNKHCKRQEQLVKHLYVTLK